MKESNLIQFKVMVGFAKQKINKIINFGFRVMYLKKSEIENCIYKAKLCKFSKRSIVNLH